MQLGILGSGIVGRTIGARLVELGHDVTIGTRDVASTLARSEPDRYGNQPFRVWQQQHPQVRLGTFADAAAFGEIVINATNGAASLEALTLAGAANLDGKVLIDIANPLDFSQGMPPSLSIVNTDSLGEQIQRAFPNIKVVKALNTMNTFVMAHPQQLARGDHSVFVSGNDAAAKAQVTDILRAFGWIDVIDLGDITTARGTEMLLPIWLRLWGALGTGLFNIKVVR
jgi:8-hydroxy-5-deazaflavin:NADPH oxidoreductase